MKTATDSLTAQVIDHELALVDDLLIELFELLADLNEYLRSFNFIDQSFDESDYEFRHSVIRNKEREIEALGYFGHRDWTFQY